MEKKRLDATHFIEQYVGTETKRIRTSDPSPIDFLDFTLQCTSDTTMLKTIAVFKIKYKQS